MTALLATIVWLAAPSTLRARDNSAEAIRKALADSDRPTDDRQRDADRKPAEVLAMMGIAPGMTVADLMAGSGYYTEILSRAVGVGGRVYAQNNRISNRFGGKALAERAERLSNVTVLLNDLEDLELPEGEVDAVFMVLFYHDTYWMQVDRPQMNREILQALKPGGIFCVIDHHAAEGSGDRDVRSLHRVEAQIVKDELLEAGFELVAESDLLAHPEDDRTINVFDAAIRGKTDRFIYKFRKPESE